MRVRRFLFAVQQKDYARGHARALRHKAVRKMQDMEANLGSSLPTTNSGGMYGTGGMRLGGLAVLGGAWWGLATLRLCQD